MPDTPRSLTDLLTLFADNTTGDISAQDVRDALVSILQSVVDAHITLRGKEGAPFMLEFRDHPNGANDKKVVFWDSTVNAPTLYINGANGFYSQKWMVINGAADGAGDAYNVLHPASGEFMLALGSDVGDRTLLLKLSSAAGTYHMQCLSPALVEQMRININGEVEMGLPGAGVLLKSANGGQYRLIAQDDGTSALVLLGDVASVAWDDPTIDVIDGLTTPATVRAFNLNGVELVGKAITVASTDPAIASVSPASGVTPLTVQVTGEAGGGPVDLAGTSEAIDGIATVTVTDGLLLSDPFTRSDGPLGTAPTGQVYTVVNSPMIVSNELVCSGGHYALADLGVSDNYYVEAEVTQYNVYPHIVWRWVDASNYVFGQIDGANNKCEIIHKVAGADTVIGEINFFPLNGLGTYRIQMAGNIATLFAGGVSKGTLDIGATHAGAQFVGVGARFNPVAFTSLIGDSTAP